MKVRVFILSGLLSAFFYSTLASAADTDIQFSGFASIGYAKSFDNDSFIPAMSGEGEYRDQNVLGLRLDKRMHDRLSFAAQLISHGSDDYDPEFDWIFLKVELMQYFEVKVGKNRIPLFKYSDYLDVGYAYHWIKPPEAVYDNLFHTFEGVNFIYSRPIGNVDSRLQIYGGRSNEEQEYKDAGTVELDLNHLKGISWEIGYEWFATRLSYFESDSSFDISEIEMLDPALYLAEGAFAITGGSFMDELYWEDDTPYFAGLSFSFDFDDYFVLLEGRQIRNASSFISGDIDSGYITAGTRVLENFVFALTFESHLNKPKTSLINQYNEDVNAYITNNSVGPGDDNFDLLGAGIPDITELDSIGNDVIQVLVDSAYSDYETYTFSARWDFHDKAAAKFEYLTREAKSLGDPPKSRSDGFRIGLDLLF